jgi:photosystem II stability/assembly factor-like uncharacterized protein
MYRSKISVGAAFIAAMAFSASFTRIVDAEPEWQNVTNNVGDDHWGYNGVCLVAAVPGSERIIAGISENGLWASDDGGKTWSKLGASDKEQIKHRTHQLIFDPRDPQTFWVSGNYGAGIFKTTDGGKSFTRLGNLQHVDSVSIDLTDPKRQTMLVGLHEQARSLHKSVDGGQTWQKIGEALPEGSNHCGDPIVLDAKTFIVNTAGWLKAPLGIYRSEDAGATWTKVSDLGPSGRSLIAPDGAIYWTALYGSGIIKSADKGLTWKKLGGPARQGPIAMPGGKVAAIGGTQVYVSADGGETWEKLGGAMPFKANGIAFSEKGNCLYAWKSSEKQLAEAIVRRGM